MPATRRAFLQTATAATPLLSTAAGAPSRLSAFDIATRHPLTRDLPGADFFEGMLMGNGDIGVCVVLRPDALGLHIGKLDVWDIRVSEEHQKHVLPFPDILKLWEKAGDQAKSEGKPEATYLENGPVMEPYTAKVRDSYAKSWPRPWPCGTAWLHWDSRQVRVVRQTLDIARALYTLDLRYDTLRGAVEPVRIECFVSWDTGHICVFSEKPSPVLSVAYYPHTDRQTQLPPPLIELRNGAFFCTQLLLATAPTEDNPHPGPSSEDRTFALAGSLTGAWKAQLPDPSRPRAAFESAKSQPLRLDLTLFTSLEARDPAAHARREAERLASNPAAGLRDAVERRWREFWSRSAVEFADAELERMWYHNQYFLSLCLREGKVAPGLFGNWCAGNIGTAWHGDYHMNYNTQQVYWGVFSSNHVEQHLPYVAMVESFLPMAEWNARTMFGLPGLYFPHSAYPVPSHVNPYPVPPWGYEICETPWTVQSLWWHYLYTQDTAYLRRVYPTMKGAMDFLMAYLKKGDDGRYHIHPTVSPENWGMTVDFRLNKDCIIDLALTEFLLDAMFQASEILGVDAALRPRWAEVRAHMAEYPRSHGPHGEVWLDVAGAPPEWVYNVPVTIAPVFPCEQVGLGKRTDLLELARNTVRTIRLEGGNDLVWQPLARARLGMLDLAWFKREVRYCLMPNGIAQDRCRQAGGRYRDETNFDFMMKMGVWTENLSLPVVLNECLLQSYDGVIRLFPNTTGLGPARFANLRAVGAFLVSAWWDGKAVSDVTLHSEKGVTARVANPWGTVPVRIQTGAAVQRLDGEVLTIPTAAGATYTLAKH